MIRFSDPIAEGATLVAGGDAGRPRKGAFIHRRFWTMSHSAHTAFHEELFGPVASIIRARDTSHAIELGK